MRLSALAAIALLGSGIATGCDLSTGPRAGTFRGVYQYAFETSAFTPCGGDRAWWLTGDLSDIFAAWDRNPIPPDGVQTFYVRIRGERSGRGRYGHLGSYPYELTVEEVLEARTDTVGACR